MTTLAGIQGGNTSSGTRINKTFSTSAGTTSSFKRTFSYTGSKYGGGPSLFGTTSYGAGGSSGNAGKLAAFELLY